MKITVNLRHLETHGQNLADEVSAEAIELVSQDELIRFQGAVKYDLEVQKLEASVIAQGHVSVALECDCARCLNTFVFRVELTDWIAHLPLSGEEAVPVENDCVDLTPYIREDIFLALPQHPLCSQECGGFLREYGNGGKPAPDSGLSETGPSTWAGLDKLNL